MLQRFTLFHAFVVLSVATVESPLSEYVGRLFGACVTAGREASGVTSRGVSAELCSLISRGVSAEF